jgi:retron-type reverse transcriptase
MVAHKQALKGKRYNKYATSFDYKLVSNLLKLQANLLDGTYKPLDYRKKVITEPKIRLIEAPAYRDRVVHHAIHHFLTPFYERFFITDSYACRPGRGIHYATTRVQHFLKSCGQNLYVCQIDISKYYASINHARLMELLQEKVKDKDLINLLKIIIGSTDSGTEHDSLFTSNSYYLTKGRRGIPIGNLTSQLFANIYLHHADMYAKQQLKIHHYIRYMDDILFFHHDKAQLHIWQQAMTKFLYEDLFLTVNPRKIRLYPARQGVSFVGYVIYQNFLRLRSSSVRRFKKHYHKQLRAVANERLDPDAMRESFASWKAHAKHASSQHLIEKLESQQADYLFVRAIKRYHRKHCIAIQKSYVQTSLFDDL